MFYPERIKQVKIVVHDDYVDKLISKLHESGILQINEAQEIMKRERIEEGLHKCKESIQKIEKILEVFDEVENILKKEEEEKKNIIQKSLSFAGEILNPKIIEKRRLKKRSLEEILKESSKIFSKIEDKVINADSKLINIEEENSLIKQQKEKIEKIKYDIDLSYFGESKYLIIKAGTTENLYELEKAIERHSIKIYSKQIEKNYYSVVIIAYIDESGIIEQILRSNIFNEIEVLGFSGMPKEIIEEIDAKKDELKKEKEKTIETIKKIGEKWKEKLLILKEELIIEEERGEILSNLEKTRKTTVIDAYVEAKKAKELERLCKDVCKSHYACIFSEPEEEKAPIILNNPRWARPFESLVNTFSPPRYNEIECTVIVAPIFVIFFGLMLGDAGYGLVILLLSLFGYFRHGKVSQTIKDFAHIGILLGISTTIFGILMGGFFGDLIPRYFYSYEDKIPDLYNITFSLPLFGKITLPYDPIGDPILMLVISLLLGISALVLGIILAGIHNLKFKNYYEFTTHQLSWYLLIPSGGALIGHSLLNIWTLGSFALKICYAMLLIGLLLLIIAHKALFFFEITGLIGDWLSYVRILALGLATAGIAMTVNIMGEVAMEMHTVLIFGAILVIIVGHFGNLLFQGLGAGVHSLRLQYVEFFGRFYEGGGRLFKPFKAERIYTEIEDS